MHNIKFGLVDWPAKIDYNQPMEIQFLSSGIYLLRFSLPEKLIGKRVALTCASGDNKNNHVFKFGFEYLGQNPEIVLFTNFGAAVFVGVIRVYDFTAILYTDGAEELGAFTPPRNINQNGEEGVSICLECGHRWDFLEGAPACPKCNPIKCAKCSQEESDVST